MAPWRAYFFDGLLTGGDVQDAFFEAANRLDVDVWGLPTGFHEFWDTVAGLLIADDGMDC